MKFHHTNTSDKHKGEAVFEKEINKILKIFEIQTNYQIKIRKSAGF